MEAECLGPHDDSRSRTLVRQTISRLGKDIGDRKHRRRYWPTIVIEHLGLSGDGEFAGKS